MPLGHGSSMRDFKCHLGMAAPFGTSRCSIPTHVCKFLHHVSYMFVTNCGRGLGLRTATYSDTVVWSDNGMLPVIVWLQQIFFVEVKSHGEIVRPPQLCLATFTFVDILDL